MTTADSQSFFHRLDPLTKLLIVICISTLAIIYVNLYLMLGIIIVCLVMTFIAKIPMRRLWKYISFFSYLIFLLAIVQGIFYPYKILYPLLTVPSNSPIFANYIIFSLDRRCAWSNIRRKTYCIANCHDYFQLNYSSKRFFSLVTQDQSAIRISLHG